MYKSLMPGLIGIEADLLRTIDSAQKHGFTGVDVRMAEVPALVKQHGLDTIKARFDEASLKPGYCSLLPGRVSVDEAEWQQGLKALPELAKHARALGYTRSATVVLPFHETLSFEENFDLHVKRLQQAAPVLADYGIALGLEYVSPRTRRAGYEHVFVHNMKGMLELCDAVGTGNVGLLFDSFHWYCADESVADITQLKRAQVVVVHVNDAIANRPKDEQVAFERELPGASGVIDLAGFFEGLQQIGYDGPVTCEPMSKALNSLPDDEAAAEVSTAISKAIASLKWHKAARV